jgi:hypothetical protein
MQTYYRQATSEDTDVVPGQMVKATISSEDAIAILIQSAVTNAVNKVNNLIIDAVIIRVNDAVSNANIQGKVEAHLATVSIGDIVDEAVGNAVRDYDYDGVIDNTLDSIDIDEMVTEKVTDHLSECSIQVSIN